MEGGVLLQLVLAYNLLLSLLEESIKSVLLDFPPDKLRGILSYSLVKNDGDRVSDLLCPQLYE